MLVDAIDWAVAENSGAGSKYRGRIDTTKVAVMGQSCGGIETYEVADDPRITTTVLWNSGLLRDSQNYLLSRLRAPIAYFIGGPSDIAHHRFLGAISPGGVRTKDERDQNSRKPRSISRFTNCQASAPNRTIAKVGTVHSYRLRLSTYESNAASRAKAPMVTASSDRSCTTALRGSSST